MLNKELSHFSESSKSGNQISEYICSTFLGEYSSVRTGINLRGHTGDSVQMFKYEPETFSAGSKYWPNVGRADDASVVVWGRLAARLGPPGGACEDRQALGPQRVGAQ